jgi:hypothetical protein
MAPKTRDPDSSDGDASPRACRGEARAEGSGIAVVAELLEAVQRAVRLEHRPDPVGPTALDRIRRHARIIDGEPERNRERRGCVITGDPGRIGGCGGVYGGL